MNKEQTAERIKVMQAYVDGKTVQFMDRGKWVDITEPAWGAITSYRIKPEPLDFWLVKINGSLLAYDCKQMAGFNQIHVREVID